MKKVPICGFLSCGEEEISQEEAKQEGFSSIYSRRIAAKTHKINEMSRSHMQQHREIFSFKLNCFRMANKSDKIHAANSPKLLETCNKLSSFGSCQKYELRAAQSPPHHSISLRYFCSPQGKVAFKSRECMSPQPKMVIAFREQQKISRTSQVYQSQIERNSRKSEQTLDSCKKSDTKFMQTVFHYKQLNIDEKCSTQNSLAFHQKGGQTERTLIDCLNDEQLSPTLVRMHHQTVVGNLPVMALKMN